VRPLARLCRLYYVAPFSLGYTLILYYARGGAMAGEWLEAWLSTAALALVLAAAYAFNDACDVEIDRLNAPARPIPSGAVSRSFALGLSVTLAIGGVALAALCRPRFLAMLVAVAAGLAFYDLRSKRIGAAKQLLVAALMVSLYPLAFAQAGGAFGPRAPTLALFPAWLSLSSFAYEVLKDLGDAAGDRLAVAHPTSIQRHPELWRRIASAAILAGLPLAVAPLWLGCRWPYLAVAVPGFAAGIASPFLEQRKAVAAVYAEITIVAFAATVDVVVSPI
jgi:4-hydroxybenzoate polyprenyltransferase